MRLAVVAGIDKVVALDSKGGTEVWTANFIQEHAKRGVEIDLYAVGKSITGRNINLIEILPHPLPFYYSDVYFSNEENFMKRKEQFAATVLTRVLTQLKEKEDTYDFIIDSCSYPSFTFATKALRNKVIIIGHFPVDFSLQFYIKTFGIPRNNFFVFPSQRQGKLADFIPQSNKTIIPHGINISSILFNSNGGEHMVWLSRFHKRTNKGLEEAMRAANMVKKKLTASAYVEKTSEEYFSQAIVPLVSEYATVTRQTLSEPVDTKKFFGNAKLFLFPLQWEEPFGLVIVESLAAGTPVVAFARGSLPDIVQDGVNGFLVNPSDDDIRGNFIIKKTGLAGIAEAVEKIYAMSSEEYKTMRKKCRRIAEEKFTVAKMVDQYEAVYKKPKRFGSDQEI